MLLLDQSAMLRVSWQYKLGECPVKHTPVVLTPLLFESAAHEQAARPIQVDDRNQVQVVEYNLGMIPLDHEQRCWHASVGARLNSVR